MRYRVGIDANLTEVDKKRMEDAFESLAKWLESNKHAKAEGALDCFVSHHHQQTCKASLMIIKTRLMEIDD